MTPGKGWVDRDLYVFVVDFRGNMWVNAGFPQAIGSNALGANDLTLVAEHLPAHAFGYFLASRDRGDTYPVSNSQG